MSSSCTSSRDRCRDALQATAQDPGLLEVQLTESMLIQNVDTTLATLHELKDMGVRLAIDDVGTG